MGDKPLNIAIVAGGDSGEYEISIQSAENILANLNPGQYDARIVEIRGKNWMVRDLNGKRYPINRHDFTWQPNGVMRHFDAVINSIHGTPGENGILPAYFDLIGMPYTGCRSFCGGLTFSKYYCNKFLSQCGILVPASLIIRNQEKPDIENIITTIALPCFIKPNNGGSSCGTSRVNQSEEIVPALQKAMKEDREVVVEQFLAGKEVTCGLFKTPDRTEVFPLTEIISRKEFFDYEAKYTPGMSDEITPACIPDAISRSVQDLSSHIYDLLNCRGVVRMDYILVDQVPWFLEVNTIPGMTQHSIVPKQASISGLSLNELFGILLKDAMMR